ncbi:MAG: AcvB/VirJ family lysyl-phosphatidylglycerol hydrolase [Myxococcota bacterium]
MRRARWAFALSVTVWATASAAAPQQTLSFGRFGEVTIYRPTPAPTHAAIFLSGDGGWNRGVVDMAAALAEQDTLVLGVDTAHYLKALARSNDPCGYPAGELEALSQYVQKKLELPTYTVPALVGYSSGATLAYAALAQAPTNTFRGAISLGFCPDLPLHQPFCKGHGLVSERSRDGKLVLVEPAAALDLPWFVLHGESDQVCDVGAARDFVSRVPQAKIVTLPKVGHGFSVETRWRPPLLESFAALARPKDAARAPTSADVSDLPLIEIPAEGPESDLFAVVLSGDGGWASIDREVGGALARHGVSVVGFDSLQYFWTRRTPEDSALALGRVVSHYLGAWHKARVALVGYSRGADVLPFMASRLPAELRARVALVALLGPARSVEFEFHLSDWIGGSSGEDALATGPEVAKLKGLKLLCVFGRDEGESLCRDLDASLATRDERPGDHHFGGDYEAIAQRILDSLR